MAVVVAVAVVVADHSVLGLDAVEAVWHHWFRQFENDYCGVVGGDCHGADPAGCKSFVDPQQSHLCCC